MRSHDSNWTCSNCGTTEGYKAQDRCTRCYNAMYKARHEAETAEYMAAYRETHHETLQASSQLYDIEHREERMLKKRTYDAARRDPNAPVRAKGTAGYRTLYRPGHPLIGDGAGPDLMRHRVVLYDKIGAGPHPCYWCGVMVDWLPGKSTRKGALVVDHVDGVRGHDTPENLVPACHSCNTRRGMGERLIPADAQHIMVDRDGNKRRGEERTCEHCGTSFLVRLRRDGLPDPTKFCSRRCKMLAAPSYRQGKGVKITAEQVPLIRAAVASGRTLGSVATEYGCSAALVSMIASRKSWAHIP
jgi:hypothetical protein